MALAWKAGWVNSPQGFESPILRCAEGPRFARAVRRTSYCDSSSALRRARSLVVARRIAISIIGAPTRAKPLGLPRLRSVIRVAVPAGDHVYVVSMGNGPS